MVQHHQVQKKKKNLIKKQNKQFDGKIKSHLHTFIHLHTCTLDFLKFTVKEETHRKERFNRVQIPKLIVVVNTSFVFVV